MNRYLTAVVRSDLTRKMVILTGPRQVGKTTLARQLMEEHSQAQYLNWDVAANRRILVNKSWSPRPDLLVLDEVHKMADWRGYLTEAYDGRAENQLMLAAVSARMGTSRQTEESLTERYFSARLHPFSVSEWVTVADAKPEDALDRLIERGGFPEPFMAENAELAERWHNRYLADLVREDIAEYARIQEVRSMRRLLELLRGRTGLPLSIASLARELQMAPNTISRYLDILEALYIVFIVRPYSSNIARAILKRPKVYFFDTGLVRGDNDARLENACAAMLLKHIHFQQDVLGKASSLHYVRTKEGSGVDFMLCENGEPSVILECRHADRKPAPMLFKLASVFPHAQCIQLVRELEQEELHRPVSVLKAAQWLSNLAA